MPLHAQYLPIYMLSDKGGETSFSSSQNVLLKLDLVIFWILLYREWIDWLLQISEFKTHWGRKWQSSSKYSGLYPFWTGPQVCYSNWGNCFHSLSLIHPFPAPSLHTEVHTPLCSPDWMNQEAYVKGSLRICWTSATVNKKLKYGSPRTEKQNDGSKDIIINAKSKAQSQIWGGFFFNTKWHFL